MADDRFPSPAPAIKEPQTAATLSHPSETISPLLASGEPQRDLSGDHNPLSRSDTIGPAQDTAAPETCDLTQSELELRFPRPQGNCQLANWISDSNPDIMRVTTPSHGEEPDPGQGSPDPGLSGSFEMVSVASDDQEDTDTSYLASESDLDQREGWSDLEHGEVASEPGVDHVEDVDQPENVHAAEDAHHAEDADAHSQAGDDSHYLHIGPRFVQDTHGGENPLDHPEAPRFPEDHSGHHEDRRVQWGYYEALREAGVARHDEHTLESDVEVVDESATLLENDHEDKIHEGNIHNINNAKNSTNPYASIVVRAVRLDDSVHENEVRARTDSIEYMERSLQLPSKVVDYQDRYRHGDDSDCPYTPICIAVGRGAATIVNHSRALARDYCNMSTLVSVLTTLFFALGVVSLLLCKQDQSPPTEAAVATATVFEQLPSVETVTLAPPSLAPAASNSFGARKGQCSAEVLPNKNVLVRISGPPRDSVTLGVHRGGQMLDTKFSATAEGILINIGFWDARGAINVTVVSNRRPRVHEVFELDFGSDPIADALDVGRALAHDVAGVVASHTRAMMTSAEPVALSASAFLAGHLEDARLAAASAAKDLGSSIGSAVSSSLNSAISAAAIGLKKGQAHAKAHAKELLAHGEERIEEYAEDLGIEVLKLRIAARLWYYKMTNRLDSYEDYNRKAKLYIAEKSSSLAAQRVEKVAKMQGPSMPAVQKSQFSWWSKGFCTSPV